MTLNKGSYNSVVWHFIVPIHSLLQSLFCLSVFSQCFVLENLILCLQTSKLCMWMLSLLMKQSDCSALHKKIRKAQNFFHTSVCYTVFRVVKFWQMFGQFAVNSYDKSTQSFRNAGIFFSMKSHNLFVARQLLLTL